MMRSQSSLANVVAFSVLGMTFSVLMAFGVNFAMAEGMIENTCRAQAKEVAVQSYQSCVNQARTQRIQEIRKEYQEKLADLKSTYDQELKSLAGEKPTRKSKATKGSARTQKLPEKLVPAKRLPIRQAEEANSVVVSPQENQGATQPFEPTKESTEPISESYVEVEPGSEGRN